MMVEKLNKQSQLPWSEGTPKDTTASGCWEQHVEHIYWLMKHSAQNDTVFRGIIENPRIGLMEKLIQTTLLEEQNELILTLTFAHEDKLSACVLEENKEDSPEDNLSYAAEIAAQKNDYVHSSTDSPDIFFVTKDEFLAVDDKTGQTLAEESENEIQDRVKYYLNKIDEMGPEVASSSLMCYPHEEKLDEEYEEERECLKMCMVGTEHGEETLTGNILDSSWNPQSFSQQKNGVALGLYVHNHHEGLVSKSGIACHIQEEHSYAGIREQDNNTLTKRVQQEDLIEILTEGAYDHEMPAGIMSQSSTGNSEDFLNIIVRHEPVGTDFDETSLVHHPEEQQKVHVAVRTSRRKRKKKIPYEGEISQQKKRPQTSGRSPKWKGYFYRKGKKWYRCDLCEKSYTCKSSLVVHRRSHTGENPFQCDSCGKTFRSKAKLNTHMRTHLGLKPHTCDICGKNFSRKANLSEHKMYTHSDKRPHQCEACGKRFKKESYLTLHRKNHIKKPEEKPFECDTCDRKFRLSNSLKCHKKIHTGVKPYSCEVCKKTFVFRAHLSVHKAFVHSDKRPYACDICGGAFKTSSARSSHRQIHLSEKRFPCDKCSKSFPHRNLLQQHYHLHTGERPYICDICGKSYRVGSQLRTHLLCHKVVKPHACEFCSKTFAAPKLLRQHMRVHTGEKPYQCDRCGKAFSTQPSLTTHRRIHTGEKPYVCSFCSKPFSDYSSMVRHRRIHTRETRQRCDGCGKAFGQKDSVVHHKCKKK